MSDRPAERADPAIPPLDATGDDAPQSSGVSMMITRRQRVALVALGVTEAAIRSMSPADAHALLGLAGQDLAGQKSEPSSRSRIQLGHRRCDEVDDDRERIVTDTM